MAQVVNNQTGGALSQGRGGDCKPSVVPVRQHPSHLPQLRRSVRPLHVVGYKHGSKNGQGAVEMFVASVDDLEELKERAQTGYQSERRLVPPPRAFKAVDMVVKEDTASVEALKAANIALQTKDKQIESLTRALLERETQLKYTKSELMEARKDLQSKELLLQDAFNKLSKAAVERQQLRDQLILSEQELQQRLEEVMCWSDGLSELNSIVDSIDSHTDDNNNDDSSAVAAAPLIQNNESSAENILFKILQLSEDMVKVAKEDEKQLLSDQQQLQ